MKRNLFLPIAVGAVAMAGFLVSKNFGSSAAGQWGNLDAFAQCLAGKEAAMYGADWCPHCQNEKRAFGNSFKFIPYVECPADPRRCLAAGIAGYPTWIFSDGRRLEGEQGLAGLAAASGCPLPDGNN